MRQHAVGGRVLDACRDLHRGATYPIQRLITLSCTFVVVPYAAGLVADAFVSPGLGVMHLLISRSHFHPGTRLRLPVALAWVGTSSTFATAPYPADPRASARETGTGGSREPAALERLVGGLLPGLVGVLLLVGHTGRRPSLIAAVGQAQSGA